VSYVDEALKLPWYCELCERMHIVGAHDEGVSWPIRLVTDMPPSRWCWCGRRLPLIGPICHDPYDIYMCSCGLHLFASKDRVSPGMWAWHLNHIAAFQAAVQCRIDGAFADARPVELQDVPDWAVAAVGALGELLP
jgi:hypothetical protein